MENKNLLFRTDLAIEEINKLENVDIEKTENIIDDIKITKLIVTNEIKKIINKKNGIYITIEFDDVTDFHKRESLSKIVTTELKKLLNEKGIKEEHECLVIGLGNANSTADALGPLTIDNTLVTRHLFEISSKITDGIRKVSAISPGVMGQTGIETSELIKNIISSTKPDFIIIIDALAASSISRVNKTIQMTDTGIHPGSGVGNKRKEISESIFNIPVIAIGVPTVVDAVTIVNDTINMLYKHISYIKENKNINKLVVKHQTNYDKKLENMKDLSDEEKKNIIGLIGTLTEEEKISLLKEVLDQTNYNLIVTPKEIDYLVEKLSDIISNSINNALHKEIKNNSLFI